MSDKYPGGFVTANAPAGFSVAFDGTGDYLNWTGSTVGTAAYTFECWFYTGSFAASQTLIGPNSTTNSGYGFNVASSTALSIDNYGVSASNFTVPAMSTNTWYHVAVVRNGSGVTTVFLNGARSSTGTITDTTNYGNVKSIGYTSSAVNRYFSGYISNARYVTAAVYDPTATTITVPTQLFPVTNTQLLTCQSPTIIDNSTNNFTITANGNAAVSNFTPFAAYQGFNPALGAAAGGVWTIDEAAYYQNNRQWPIYDPYFKNTTLMLHGNSTGTVDSTGTPVYQNNTFLDSSNNNSVITRNGNTTQGSFSPFSQTGWSVSNTINQYCQLNNADYSFSTGDFTVELWMYCVDDSTYAATNICSAPSNPNFTVGFGSGSAGARQLYVEYGGGATTGIGSSMSGYLNKWTHIAVVRQSGIVTAYQNGVSLGSVSKAAAVGSTANLYLLRNTGDTGQDFRGYVSNLRISKSAVYTSNFTPSTAPFAPVSNTVLLTFQSNRFVDNSAINATVTPTATTIQAFSPFVPAYITPTTYSNRFDGTGDYLTLASNAAFTFGTGDFTIEAWVYNTNSSTGRFVLYSTNSPGTSGGLTIFQESTSLIYFRIDGGNDLTTTAPSINAWNHIAVTRASGTVRIFVNGILNTSATRAQDVTQNTPYIGDFPTGSYSLNGCMSNLRVLKGTALYTAAFTPPTAPLTNITNTSLLTCQSPTIIDNSTNNFTITATGNVQPVTSPTPFPANVDTTTLNSAYSTSLIGGSGYFDGTGDYLTLPANAAFNFNTGDFTLETWIYMPSFSTFQEIFSQGSGNFQGIGIYTTTSGKVHLDLGNGSSWYANAETTNSLKLNSWNHVAIVRQSTTYKIYLNGASDATTTTATFPSDASGASSYIAVYGPLTSQLFTGYLSGFRIVKGTGGAIYTSNFAPPVAPPTNITNTSLLTNFTNGAIFDNTAKNVLETVGNAQISTTQSKWGGSSMYFDGTGDYLRGNANLSNSIAFGTSDFTIELWVYCTSISVGTSDTIIDGRPGANTGSSFLFYLWDGGKIAWFVPSLGTYIVNTGAVSANTWTHVAICRSGSTLRSFKDGVLQQAGTDNVNYMNPGSPYPFIGSAYFGGDFFRGYMDDLRITRAARYITNFTPPTSQLQDQ